MRARPIQRVLVVDDDEILLCALARHARGDLEIVTAGALADAIAVAAAEAPDLAIVDLRLGVSSGLDVVTALRAEHPLMPIVVASAFSTVRAAIDATLMAIRAGADLIVEKPIMCREIVRRLEEEWRVTSKRTQPSAGRIEQDLILSIVRRYGGNITASADALGIARQSLQRKLRKGRLTD